MKKQVLKWLYEVPGKNRLSVLILTFISIIYSTAGVFYSLILKGAVDAVAAGSESGFRLHLIFFAALILFQLAVRFIYRRMSESVKAAFENLFKLRLTRELFSKGYLEVAAVHSGEWMNRLTGDAVIVADSYAEIIPGAAGMVLKLLSAAAMLIVLEPAFAYIIIPGGILLIVTTYMFRKSMKRLHKDVQEADGKVRMQLQDDIISMLMIRSFGAEEQAVEHVSEKTEDHKKARMNRNLVSSLANVGFGLVMGGMYFLGALISGYGVLKGAVTFGTLTAVLQLTTQIQAPLSGITGYLPRYYAAAASAERLMEAESFGADHAEAGSLDQMLRIYDNDLRAIGFDDVSFAYNDRKAAEEADDGVLKHASFRIEKGQFTALMGRSGSGKSTAVKLLMCVFEPNSGMRYYEGHDGTRNELTAEHRRLFAYVPQDNQLMSGSVRDIVSFADSDSRYDDARIGEALRMACADEFIGTLKDGIDTVLGERGAGLSQGQMQRLAVARAVFSGSPILLLDEATSALDAFTESRLIKNLKEDRNRTVILITHRDSAAKLCDRIIGFSEGRAAEPSEYEDD